MEKILYISLFYKSFLIIQYILGDKIKTTILFNLSITRFRLIKKKFAKIVCQSFEIQF